MEGSQTPVVLVLCTGNSCRSQMAEGVLRHASGTPPAFTVLSAGSQPAGFVHPLAVRVMAEIGIDIGAQRSKSIDEVTVAVSTVITVCDKADAACPFFPGRVRRHHYPFEDPAHVEGSEEVQLAAFRRIRDDIRRVFVAYADGRRDQQAK